MIWTLFWWWFVGSYWATIYTFLLARRNLRLSEP